MTARLTPVTTDGLVIVTEPHEAAFTILMPAGWENRADLQREHSLNRILAAATCSETSIRVGEPRMPIFMEPGPFVDPVVLSFNPHMRVQPCTPADRFLHDYACQCFGGAPGFRVTAVGPSPEFHRMAIGQMRTQPAMLTTGVVTFEHSGGGTRTRGRVLGATFKTGFIWCVDLVTITTTGDLEAMTALALRMMTSRSFRPSWAAAQQQLHEQRMAMGQQQIQHIENMTRLQQQGHEQRMRDIQAFGEANTRMHNDRMAQMDSSHQTWLTGQAQSDASHRAWMDQQARDDQMQQARVNAIREEHTVIDSSGATYQVDSHHERYFINPRDNTYIGVNGATELSDLRRTHGVNPDDFVEVRIVR